MVLPTIVAKRVQVKIMRLPDPCSKLHLAILHGRDLTQTQFDLSGLDLIRNVIIMKPYLVRMTLQSLLWPFATDSRPSKAVVKSPCFPRPTVQNHAIKSVKSLGSLDSYLCQSFSICVCLCVYCVMGGGFTADGRYLS